MGGLAKAFTGTEHVSSFAGVCALSFPVTMAAHGTAVVNELLV